MAQPITPTVELLHKLLNAQAKQLAEEVSGPAEIQFWSDDTCDYVDTALEVFNTLFSLYRGYYEDIGNEALEILGQWLNAPSERGEGEWWRPINDEVPTSQGPLNHLLNFSGGGIAEAFYQLDCPALPKERD